MPSYTVYCRSSAQIYEDNVCELHTRLTCWQRELRNEPCFNHRERERKRECLKRLGELVQKVEYAIEHATWLDIYSTERWGIAYAAMRLTIE